MGDGRFGPVFRAHDADGAPVVIRTFTATLTSAQRARLMAALTALCEAPLDHPSIARPITAGLTSDGQPYVVHTFLPGTPLTEGILGSSAGTVDDDVNRLTYVAGALDFAAAAGVLHGALSLADVIFTEESAGLSGLGLVQALQAAGVDGFHARREDDVAALMTIAGTLLAGRSSSAVEAVLSGPVPGSALAFAADLRDALHVEPDELLAPPPLSVVDLPLIDPGDFDADRFEPETVAAAAPVPVDVPLERDLEPDMRERLGGEFPVAPAMFGATEQPVEGHRGSRSWLLVGAIALMLGVAAGYAGGFFVRSDAPATPPVVTSEPPASQPAPTSGQTYTDAPVENDTAAVPAAPGISVPPRASAPTRDTPGAQDEPRAQSAPQPTVTQRPQDPPQAPPRAVPPAAPPAAAASAAPPERNAVQPRRRTAPPADVPPARSGPAAMRVDSRPTGAQVFIDGRSVGYTPMVVGELTPGTHSIRMQLPGYRPWVTAVTLEPGARERVAASLEQ